METLTQEIIIGSPVVFYLEDEPFVGLVKAISNGKAFIVGIATDVAWLEPVLIPIDDLYPAGEEMLQDAAENYCRVNCGTEQGLCWGCRTLVKV